MPQLTPYQQMWLKQIGFTGLEQVKTCDPDRETITFLDGTIRQHVQCWSRAMGYFRPVEYWNSGKQQEHRDRKYFAMPARRM